jgi:hypothetical protein
LLLQLLPIAHLVATLWLDVQMHVNTCNHKLLRWINMVMTTWHLTPLGIAMQDLPQNCVHVAVTGTAYAGEKL